MILQNFPKSCMKFEKSWFIDKRYFKNSQPRKHCSVEKAYVFSYVVRQWHDQSWIRAPSILVHAQSHGSKQFGRHVGHQEVSRYSIRDESEDCIALHLRWSIIKNISGPSRRTDVFQKISEKKIVVKSHVLKVLKAELDSWTNWAVLEILQLLRSSIC